MKNLLKNRRGFTLAEILLVVAIVVVLSGATIIGVASWVNQSQATANQLTAKSADFEKDAVKDVNEKKGTVNDNPIETESLPTGTTLAGGSGNSGSGNSGSGNSGSGNSGGDSTEATGSSKESSSSSSSSQSSSESQGGSVLGHQYGFTNTAGTHWDPNYDGGYDEWGNHKTGAHVPDTTMKGKVSFGSRPVEQFTVKVEGKVLWYQCNDWRYTVNDNGDGTYTFTYTANQYKDNPPISTIEMTFNVDGDKAAKIKVVSTTEYKP